LTALRGRAKHARMSTDNPRVDREEQYWTGPRLVRLGVLTLAAAVALIVIMANLRDWM